jgi:hypothetical protein
MAPSSVELDGPGRHTRFGEVLDGLALAFVVVDRVNDSVQ